MPYKIKSLQHIKRRNQDFKGVDSINSHNRLFNLEDLKRANKELIKSLQQRQFKEEITTLHNRKSLKSLSRILKLDPFLDQDGILKLWGRIGKYDISDLASNLIAKVLQN